MTLSGDRGSLQPRSIFVALSLNMNKEKLLYMTRLYFYLVLLGACSPIELPFGNKSLNDSSLTEVRVELVQGPAMPMAMLHVLVYQPRSGQPLHVADGVRPLLREERGRPLDGDLWIDVF